jgi:glycopeptide antibiotics resistance protein
MASPATTIRVFGIYLLALAAALMVAPNAFLGLFGVPETTDVWVRVVGMLAGFLGYYYLRAVAAGMSELYAWTVPARMSVLAFFGAFVALGLAPPSLLLFAAVDAAAAVWTWLAIRQAAARA